MKPTIPICCAALAATAAAAPAFAHHSFAMFDRSKTLSITGQVKEFDMINPHGWLQLLVTDPQGAAREWSLEMGGPGQLSRAGFDQKTLSPGARLTAQVHPLKDGSNGGQLISVTLADGRTLSAQPGFGRGFGR